MSFDPETAIRTLYAVDLHRDPDVAGLAYWLAELQHGATLATIATTFEHSVEYLGTHSQFTGTATDVASQSLTRTANYTGGQPGYVNGAVRDTDTVGPAATAFEWTLTSILNNSANAGENVAIYAQGNGSGAGPTWAMVAEAYARGAGTIVGLEVDAGRNNPGLAVGIDVVNTGGMTFALLLPENVPAVVDDAHRDTYLDFTPGGGFEIVVHGIKVMSWP